MKNTLFITILSVFSFNSLADFTTHKFKTYEEIIDFTTLETQEHGLEELLIVFDIDRTLIETLDCLPKDREFSNGFFEFEAKVNACAGELTSPLVPEFINELKQSNISVMALTARRDKILTGTLAQLEDRLLVSEETGEKSKLTFETAPLYSNRKTTIKFDQQGKKKVLKKTLVIKRGVAMASGSNKGLALQAFMAKAAKKGQTISRIIFVDDDSKNIRNLEKAFKDSSEYISIIHYTEHSK